MDTLWDRVRKNLIEWYEVASDKTEEVARVGRRKIEMTGINRSIEKRMVELGGRVYDLISVEGHRGNKTADDEKVRKLVKEIGRLEEELEIKEQEIKDIREMEKEEASEAGPAEEED
ncbi:MAG: hypothetical protein R6U43_02205 [Candidatus Krumholzibacteriales bacterium]